MSNILLALSHSIEEYDQLRLLTSIGHNVASIGGYIDPRHPHDPKRPALDIDVVPEIKEAVDGLGTHDNLGEAQANLPAAILDWADVIVYHHFLDRLFGQWGQIRQWLKADSAHRVIWRTVGQSVENNERTAQTFHADGLEIVRYSPKERNIPGFAGENALIRFYKDPAEWGGWTGEQEVVLNISQHDREPHGRDVWLNWGFWEEATKGLPTVIAGPNSELIGGLGTLSLDDMKAQLRSARCYLYTGTQPASYTLGLIEAGMTGVPVVSIDRDHMTVFPYGPDLFEGGEIALFSYYDPDDAKHRLESLLQDPDYALAVSGGQRVDFVDLFGMDTIASQWREFLR